MEARFALISLDDQTVGIESSTVRSYKEILLRYPEDCRNKVTVPQDLSLEALPQAHVSKSEWKPQIVLENTSYLRKDRLYGPQLDVVDHDIDDDGVWGFIEDHIATKHATSVSRYRSMTMLTPIQQEKKAVRIAQKSSNSA